MRVDVVVIYQGTAYKLLGLMSARVYHLKLNVTSYTTLGPSLAFTSM
jgi:hypothetical protein